MHLNQRDVTMVTVSRAPLDKLEAFRQRMGWKFRWASSHGNTFNRDYQVTFTPEEVERGDVAYNYGRQSFPVAEGPGLSVFAQDDDGAVFHTYSCFSRELETYLGIYRFLDAVPKGRDEGALKYGMEWVRHHDRYGDAMFVDPYVTLLTPRRADEG